MHGTIIVMLAVIVDAIFYHTIYGCWTIQSISNGGECRYVVLACVYALCECFCSVCDDQFAVHSSMCSTDGVGKCRGWILSIDVWNRIGESKEMLKIELTRNWEGGRR